MPQKVSNKKDILLLTWLSERPKCCVVQVAEFIEDSGDMCMQNESKSSKREKASLDSV